MKNYRRRSKHDIYNSKGTITYQIQGYALGLFLFALFTIVIIGILNNDGELNTNDKNIQINKIKTAKGFVSLAEILENAYKPNGFDVDLLENNIIPKIRMKKTQTCNQIYTNWLAAAKTDITPSNNPQILLKDNFTLNGYSTMSKCYYNDSYNNAQSNYDEIIEASKRWTQQSIDKWINQIKNGNNSELQISQYSDGVSLYYATKYYNIIGKVGAVIGSIIPWVETMCLTNGASKVVTIDYQYIKIGHKDIIFLDAFDIVKRKELYFNSFDFIASFSSIEHSGLGRYGDPIDPIGDIREMQKLSCILKPGGLFFLGIPVGQDDVGYNCHRTYGRIRLPLMFAGFQLLDVFYMQAKPLDLNVDVFEDNHGRNPINSTQFVFVLKNAK
uniref:DUF268 domain-containing protein n=1 Tax=Meloidogyne hapla TaxID=6305 RepID=A0A1I8AYF1_MELHA